MRGRIRRRTAIIPDSLPDLARVGTRAGGCPRPDRGSEWFRPGPARDVPGPVLRGGPGRTLAPRAWRTLHVPYIRPTGRGGARPDVRWFHGDRCGTGGGLADHARTCPRQSFGLAVPGRGPPPAASSTRRARRATGGRRPPRRGRIAGSAPRSCGPDTLPEYLVGPGTYRLVLDAGALTACAWDARRAPISGTHGRLRLPTWTDRLPGRRAPPDRPARRSPASAPSLPDRLPLEQPDAPARDYAAKLTRLGLPTPLDDILVSTQVASPLPPRTDARRAALNPADCLMRTTGSRGREPAIRAPGSRRPAPPR